MGTGLQVEVRYIERELKGRREEILRILTTAPSPVDMAFFCDRFQKSERTIRYDIDSLKEICRKAGVEICYAKKKGFYIPVTQKTLCSELLLGADDGNRERPYGESEAQRAESLFLLLFQEKKRLSAEKIAERLYMSRSTLLRLIPGFQRHFKNQIALSSKKSEGYAMEGEEFVIRKLAAEILAVRFRGSYTAEDWYLMLPDGFKQQISLSRLLAVSDGIKKINGRYNVWISNRSFLNLLSYCIAREIRRNQMKLLPGGESSSWEGREGYAVELLKELSLPGCGLEEDELSWLQRILQENGVNAGSDEVDEEVLDRILNRIISYLNDAKGEGVFDGEGLYQDLHDHLKNSMGRNRDNEEENQYIIEEIMDNYQSFYLIAKECAEVVERESGITFNQTEICYIAVYLYKNCRDSAGVRKNVMVVCATGKGLSNLLAMRVKNVFPNLNVVGQASPYQITQTSFLKNVDFVISTIPMEHAKVPVVKISSILSEEDCKRILEFLKYGEMLDEIPMNQENEASFGAKADPFALRESTYDYAVQNVSYAANVLSRLILTLMEYTSKFPQKNQIEKEALLGLIIHMTMAIPRWFERTGEAASDELKEEYEALREHHKECFIIMEKFFELVEESLQVKIPVSEKMAFFLYIIKEETI